MDDLMEWMGAWVHHERQGHELRREVGRHVATVARPYPDAYFSLSDKSTEAIDDLANRVFTVCSRVSKGRYPFRDRPPFRACVEDRMPGRDARYHCFYARLSVTRELLRGDYAQNLRRSPALRWRAELFGQVGAALERIAVPSDGQRRTAIWHLEGRGPSLVRREDQVIDALKRSGERDVEGLVQRALTLGGPSTQSRLTNLLAEVLAPPAGADGPAREADEGAEADPSQRLAVRAAIREVWEELGPEDRRVLIALGRGASYDDLIAADPRFKHRVAVTRAVERINRSFLTRLAAAFEEEISLTAPPKEILDLILDVLEELSAGGEPQQRLGGAA